MKARGLQLEHTGIALQRRGDEIGALADPRQTVDFIRASMRIDLGSMSSASLR